LAGSSSSKQGRETVTKRQFYVYAIYVDGVARYIGKGSNGRMHFHVIEARRINSRRARGANTDRTATKFYRKLAEAMRHGATITEKIMLDGLTNQRAHLIEKQKIEELHKQKRDQLWNTIDERLIGITWEKFKRKQREESFQRRQGHRPAGGPAGSQGARLAGFLSERALKTDPFLRQQGTRHPDAGR
jgi:hypothetical protein